MTAPSSQDLRQRVVGAVEKGHSVRQAAARYEVSPRGAVKLMWPVIRNVRKSFLAPVAVAAAPIWLYFQLFREALIDDTFITLQYVRTLRDHGIWGFYPWEVTNTATSPLNVLLTAAISLGVQDLVQAALALATLEALALLAVLLLLSQHITRGCAFGVFSFLAVVRNPLLLSTIGLEPLLYTTLLVACVYAFLIQHYTSLAVLLALLTLTRPDGVLLFPLVVIAILLRHRASEASVAGEPREGTTDRWRAPLRLVAWLCLVYALCLVPWYIFSWIYLGSVVPSTFGIKLRQGTWDGFSFSNGALLYGLRYPWETLFALLLTPFACLCLKIRNRRAALAAALLAAFGTTYFAAYAALGVPPYHWYFVPVVIPYVILGVLGLLTAAEQINHAQHSLIRGIAVILSRAVVLSGLIYLLLGRGDPLMQPPIHTNYATHQQYREIGLWLRNHVEPDANVRVDGEIGTIAFYAERRLADAFSCRLANHRIMEEAKNMTGLQGVIVRANFYWLRDDTACVPAKYELHMYSRAVPPMNVLSQAMKSWEINSNWVSSGSVVLMRSEMSGANGSEPVPWQKPSP
jgi:hypothetical protein